MPPCVLLTYEFGIWSHVFSVNSDFTASNPIDRRIRNAISYVNLHAYRSSIGDFPVAAVAITPWIHCR